MARGKRFPKKAVSHFHTIFRSQFHLNNSLNISAIGRFRFFVGLRRDGVVFRYRGAVAQFENARAHNVFAGFKAGFSTATKSPRDRPLEMNCWRTTRAGAALVPDAAGAFAPGSIT